MTKQIPIIGSVTEQKLIISFTKSDVGEGNITFNFDPPILEAITPEQRAAVNVAHQVIRVFNLDGSNPTKTEEPKHAKNSQTIIN